AEERAGETVPAAVRDGERRSHARGGGAHGHLEEGDRAQDRGEGAALDHGGHPARHDVRSAEPRGGRRSGDLEASRRGHRAAALHLRRPLRSYRRRERLSRASAGEQSSPGFATKIGPARPQRHFYRIRTTYLTLS